MRIANKHAIPGLLITLVLAAGGVAAYAHGGDGHGLGMHNDSRLSITGSPDELAQRARDLGQHICETIKAASNCPVTPAADAAFNDLSSMQNSYQQDMQRMHEQLTSAAFDRSEFTRIQTGQAQTIQTSSTRYLQFLADSAAALTPEQRQLFSHKAHGGS